MRWLLGNPTDLASTAFIGPHCPHSLVGLQPWHSSARSVLPQPSNWCKLLYAPGFLPPSLHPQWELPEKPALPSPNKGTPNPAILMNFSSWFHSINHLIAYYTIYFFFMFMAYFYLLLQNYNSMIICSVYWLNSRDIEECLVLVGDRYWLLP